MTTDEVAEVLITSLAQQALIKVVADAGSLYAPEYVLDGWKYSYAVEWQADPEKAELEWLARYTEDSIDDRGPADIAYEFSPDPVDRIRWAAEDKAHAEELARVRFVQLTALGYQGSSKAMVADEYGTWAGSASTHRGLDMVCRRVKLGPTRIQLAGPWVRLTADEAVRLARRGQAVTI